MLIEKIGTEDEAAITDKNAVGTVSKGHGLLALASGGIYLKRAGKTQQGRGLLALANNRKFANAKRPARGLLAAASEIEFYKPIEENNDPYAEVNIISPFLTMFSTLDGGE